jgi:hypothetical protein
MDKTVPSFRMALEMEIAQWDGFRDKLSPAAQEAFDELMDMCRGHATASGNACNPVIFEPMAISILLAQQRKLRQLEHELNELLEKNEIAS